MSKSESILLILYIIHAVCVLWLFRGTKWEWMSFVVATVPVWSLLLVLVWFITYTKRNVVWKQAQYREYIAACERYERVGREDPIMARQFQRMMEVARFRFPDVQLFWECSVKAHIDLQESEQAHVITAEMMRRFSS